MDFDFTIEGLDELGQSIKDLSDNFPDMIREITENVAEMVVGSARPTIPVQSGRAARSLRAVSNGERATVVAGEGIDYYAWLEFGGDSGRNHSNHRPVVPEGRYIFPGFQRIQGDIEELMAAILREYLDESGLGGG